MQSALNHFFFNSLRLISPVIGEHGVDYERGKFQDKLDDGSLTLKNTKVQLRDKLDISYV